MLDPLSGSSPTAPPARFFKDYFLMDADGGGARRRGAGSYRGGVASDPLPTVWPVLHYEDTSRAREFLVSAFGFREAIAVRGDDGGIIHAEMRWPEGGAIVFGSTRHTDGVHGAMRPGTGAAYVVTADVDAVHARAVRGGATIVEPPSDTTFGSGVRTRAFTAEDPERNLWTFGTYRGVP